MPGHLKSTVEGKHNSPDESNHRARNWIFTLNNYTDLEIAKLKVYADDKCKYMLFAKEVGKTGVPHLQGYFQLKTQTVGQTVKNQAKVLRMWMGMANGSPAKNRKYITKQYQESEQDEQNAIENGDIVEIGEPDETSSVKAGSRKGGGATQAKWKQLSEDINAGMSYEECLAKYPSMVMQTRNAVMAECLRNAPKRNFKTCVHVLYGDSGTKKTTRGLEEHGGRPVYMKGPASKDWFDGYNGRDDVLLDEFRGQLPLGTLLFMMDKFQCHVQVKGGMVNFAPRRLTITSNLHPDEWYSADVLMNDNRSAVQSRIALWRRINVIQEFKKNANGSVIESVAPPAGMELWNEGCVCGYQKKFTRNGTLILTDEDEQALSPDPLRLLDNSSFLDEEHSNGVKRKLQSTPKNPKKMKVKPHGKQVGPLTKKMDELYPDSVVVKNKPLTLNSLKDSETSTRYIQIDSSSSSDSESMEEESDSVSEDIE